MRLRTTLISTAVTAAGVLAFAGTAVAAPTKVGTETAVSVQDINANGGPVTVTGVINDHGTDVHIDDTTDRFDFGANGSIEVHHVPTRQVEHFSQKTCTGTFREAGVYTLDHGTGEWAGYIGSGKYKLVGTISDACTGPGTGTSTLVATGPLSLLNTNS
jgi:hypothetical protein